MRSIKELSLSDLILVLIGIVVGTGAVVAGIFIDYICVIGGITILIIAFLHLIWACRK